MSSSLNPPGDYPQNELTEMIEEVARLNAAGGGGARRMPAPGPVSAEPGPTVRSAAMGQPVAPLPPLSPEERMELDQKARELGIMPRDDEPVGEVYATLADAIAAGASVHPPVAVPPPNPPGSLGAALTPRERAQFPQPTVVRMTRLPDFKKVQGIDLIRGVAFVDSLEFTMDAATVADLRTLVLGLARESIMAQFDAALTDVQEAKDGGAAEEV